MLGFQCDKCEKFTALDCTHHLISGYAGEKRQMELCDDCYADVREFMGYPRVPKKGLWRQKAGNVKTLEQALQDKVKQ